MLADAMDVDLGLPDVPRPRGASWPARRVARARPADRADRRRAPAAAAARGRAGGARRPPAAARPGPAPGRRRRAGRHRGTRRSPGCPRRPPPRSGSRDGEPLTVTGPAGSSPCRWQVTADARPGRLAAAELRGAAASLPTPARVPARSSGSAGRRRDSQEVRLCRVPAAEDLVASSATTRGGSSSIKAVVLLRVPAC